MIMNKRLSSSTSTNSINGTKPSNCVMSKLRRLKIEEHILLQDLQKLDGKKLYEVTEPDIVNNLDCKNMLKNLKDSYYNVKNLFDDVKTVTCSQELLAELEIEDIRKKVLELETTLKSFKTYLSSELNSLKIAEHEITKQLEDIRFNEAGAVRKRSKTLTKNYNQAVPSPVRLLMTSPFKCSEVEEFQNFMKSSLNRYGGWNEYYHNIFVKYWQKYFGTTSDVELNELSIVGKLTIENFIEETLTKLQGIDKESLMSHIEWYKKYLVLKDHQQKAIDKWKSNRRLIRKAPKKTIKNLEKECSTNHLNDLSCYGDEDDLLDFDQIASKKPLCSEMKKKSMKQTIKLPKVLGQDDIERLTRPTKQWLNRNYDIEQKDQTTHFIENLEKLRIPYWRQYLA